MQMEPLFTIRTGKRREKLNRTPNPPKTREQRCNKTKSTDRCRARAREGSYGTSEEKGKPLSDSTVCRRINFTASKKKIATSYVVKNLFGFSLNDSRTLLS